MFIELVVVLSFVSEILSKLFKVIGQVSAYVGADVQFLEFVEERSRLVVRFDL